MFVNYTAAWCVSCQVNDRVVLSTRPVVEAMKRNGVAYLKADWTSKSPEIAALLESFGRSGVPLYVLYRRGSSSPRVLPQILSEGTILAAVRKL